MAELHRCPQCGAEVPADAPQGLCPNCVLKAGMGTQQTGSFSQSESGSASASANEARFVPPTPAESAPYFPDLEILAFVGQGGMGMVYKARQKRLDRLVALKILSPKIGQDPGFAARFQREARAMAMLSHPHIVAVYDFDQTTSPLPLGEGQGVRVAGSTLPSPVLGRGAGGEGLYYFLMEFIDGVNLRQLLNSGKLAPQEALAIVPQICDALQYAHDHGVVHRDIKPENLLLAKSGEVKIADFGLAKLVGRGAEDLTLSGAGHVMGTPQYMAPEQIEHPLEVDHRADIYSLGVVFYQMLTGELPIGRFAPPSKKVQIDVRLDEVVLRALEKEPELRYQQASEIKTEVEGIVTEPLDNPAPQGPAARPRGGAAPPGASLVPQISRHAVWGTAWAAFAVTFVLMKIVGGGPGQFDALEKLARILSLAALPVVPILGARALLEIRHSGGQVSGLGWALFDVLVFPLLGLDALIGFMLYWGWASMGGGAFDPGGPGPVTVLITTVILSLIIDFVIVRWAWRAAKPSAGSGPRPHEPPGSTSPAAHRKPLRWHAGWFTVAVAILLAAFFSMPDFFQQRFVNAPAGAVNPNTGQPAQDESADASQRPQLRFLAWQSGNDKTQGVSVLWKPGSDPLLNANDKQLLAHLDLPPDYTGPLTCANSNVFGPWFSSPRLDSRSFFKIQLLDEAGHPIQSDGGTFGGGFARSPAKDYQNLGWIVATAGIGKRGKALTAVNVVLHYSGGDWKRGPWTSSDFSGLTVAPLDDHTLVSGVGQTADGKAFVTVTRIDAATPKNQFAFIAETRDGKQVNSDESAQRGAGDTLTALFVFPTPLSNVKTFTSRQRAIHTIEFKNVSLQPEEKTWARGTPAPAAVPDKPAEAAAAQADPLQSPRAAQMRTIVLAALEYATEHGAWPKTLDELKPRYVEAGKIDLSQFVYHPLSQESSEKNPQEVAVLSEKKPASPDGQLVGFADGYVEFITPLP